MWFSIMELECSAIQMMFESRPRSSGLTFGLSVGGLQLLDKLTENSQFPCLVGSQNKVTREVFTSEIQCLDLNHLFFKVF